MTTSEACITREKDRASSRDLKDVFSLGDICLNAFPLPDEEDTDAYPLTLAYSPESQLVQLRHTVDPELMFRTYWYNSGTNEAMQRHLQKIALEASGYVALKPSDTVVDIGCNDGTLLAAYPSWLRKVGYDPAKNLNPACDLFINDFFRSDPQVKNAKIITSIAMFYDVDDPVGFARTVREMLHDDGVWVIEMHYLPTMLDRNEVDAICHEHLCYYSLTSLTYVLRQAGLSPIEVYFNNVNGGSMRVYVKKAGRASAPSPTMQNVMQQESRIPWEERIAGFAERVERNRDTLVGMILRLSDHGIIGYGASTKGNTLLQYSDVDYMLLDAIADRNPLKHGRETVKTRIPIISEEQMRDLKPDYLLALPYHFIDAFREREDSRFKWAIPVPHPQVVS